MQWLFLRNNTRLWRKGFQDTLLFINKLNTFA